LVDVNNMRSNGTSFERFTYTYDGAGNRTRVLELTGHRMTFSYDNANQLVREQRSDTVPDLNWDYTHTYDGVGNRTVWSDPGSDVNYSFDAANQVTADTYVTPYTYDAAGNMTRAVYLAPYTLTWDAENRLTRYEDGYFGIDNRYQYDGDGRRVRREALNPGSVFQYVWDFENVLLETDDNGALATRYTLEPEMFGNLLSDKVVYFFNAERYYHFDGLGSTRRLTNFQSTPLDATMHYEAFGFPRNAGDPFSSYRWLGQIGYQLQVIPGNGFLFGGYYDYANFYVRQRYYDRWTARWTSRDPLRADGRANLYAYVSNMPTILRDPMGLEPIYNPNAIEPKRDPCPDARPIQGPKQRGGNGDLYGPTPPFVFPDVSEGPKPGPMQGPIGPPNGMQGPVIGPSPGGMQPGKTPHYYVREYYYGYVAGSFIPGIYPIDPPNIQEVSEAEYHKAATERANNRRRTLAANLQTTGSPSGSNPYSPKPNWNPLTWWEPETVVWK
jgi:RHS repeat-associated protein